MQSIIQHKIVWLYLFILLSMAAQAQQKKTSLELQFNFSFLAQPLKLQTPYKIPEGHSLTFTTIQFYLGKAHLKDAKDSKIQLNQMYHLVTLEEDTDQYTLSLGKITRKQSPSEIAFFLGIDSVSNHSGKQIGALDPLNGMFWTWSQGYIFFKVEGYYTTQEGKRGGFVYHIGGDACYRLVTLPLDIPTLKSKKMLTYAIDVRLEHLLGWYEQPAVYLKIPDDNKKISVMGGPQAPLIADNFVRAFQTRNIGED